MPRTSKEFVDALMASGICNDEDVIRAFRAVDRADFVPTDLQDLAYEDDALPIGMRQTISQPQTVLFMLGLLGARDGDTVFDVGYGSGWQTALLAHIVGKKGKVYAAEIVPELCALGESNVAKYPELFSRVVFECGDASCGAGLADDIPLDRIIVAADIESIPTRWRRLLRPGGTLVYPRAGTIRKEQKVSNWNYSVEEYPGFAFVPFITTCIPVFRSEQFPGQIRHKGRDLSALN